MQMYNFSVVVTKPERDNGTTSVLVFIGNKSEPDGEIRYALYGRKEGNVLFNDALNTFYLRLYGVTHRVKDHSDSERGNLLPPHGLLFPISSKGSFICIIPQTGWHIPQPLITSLGALAGMRNSGTNPPKKPQQQTNNNTWIISWFGLGLLHFLLQNT